FAERDLDREHMTPPRSNHIRLTSHPGGDRPTRFPLVWGAPSARERGPVVASIAVPSDRNAIVAHGGSYSVYRALAAAVGALSPDARTDLTDTSPVIDIGPHPQWRNPSAIVSLDPWGHRVAEDFKPEIDAGVDIRPTIAVTRARLTLP